MIYLPHPSFEFEGSDGGGCVGYLNPDNKIREWVKQYSHLSHYSIDIDKLISKFDKYRSYYWDGTLRLKRTNYLPNRLGFQSTNHEPLRCRPCHRPNSFAFGFLKEDGNEVAIRIIENKNHDLLGYWRPARPLERFFQGKEKYLDLLQPLMRYLEESCPL